MNSPINSVLLIHGKAVRKTLSQVLLISSLCICLNFTGSSHSYISPPFLLKSTLRESYLDPDINIKKKKVMGNQSHKKSMQMYFLMPFTPANNTNE